MSSRFHVIGDEIRMDGVLVGYLRPLKSGTYDDVRRHIEGWTDRYEEGFDDGYEEAKERYMADPYDEMDDED